MYEFLIDGNSIDQSTKWLQVKSHFSNQAQDSRQ